MSGDRIVRSGVHNPVIRGLGVVLLSVAIACGGGDKKGGTTTPAKKPTDQSMKDTGEPDLGTLFASGILS